jgi:lipopolysaccharide/colanic/teichoic acid biosynthesis glycosyltransferase
MMTFSLQNKLVETVDSPDSTTPEKNGSFGYTNWSFVFLTISNALLALFFIILGAPLYLLIGVGIKLHDDGPVFYRGIRLGLLKKPFYMYKFRTLPVGTQQQLGPEQLSPQTAPTTGWISPFMAFLRDSRLDELPQLFNILRGDMDFIGPRPMRPEYYEAKARHIEQIDRRFTVRPGLIGYSQLLTPHGSPQRLRTLIDNRYIQHKRRFFHDFLLIFWTVMIFIKRIIVKGLRLIWDECIHRKLLGRQNKRRYRRTRLQDAHTCFEIRHIGAMTCESQLIDINDESIRMHSNMDLAEGEAFNFILEITIQKGNREKKKKAACTGTIFRKLKLKNDIFQYAYIVMYHSHSSFHQYVLDQYFFRRSMA